MNKKVISAILAGTMALSTLGTTAFAADKVVKAAGATTYKVSATLAAPEINVTVPGAVSAMVNPYGVSFEMKGTTYGATGLASGTYTIKNNTTASAVLVSVTPTITVPTKADATDKTKKIPTIKVLADEASDYEKLTEKSIYATVVGMPGDANVDVGTADDKIPAIDLTGKKVTSVPFIDATLMDKDTLAAQKATGLMVIPKATKEVPESAEGADDGTPATFGYGQFTIGGDITPNSVATWTSADKISLNIVLDIGPCADDLKL